MKTQKKTRKTSAARSSSQTKKVLRRRSVAKAWPLHKRIILHPIYIFFLLCAGVFIVGLTFYAFADSYDVTAKVPAPIPPSAATIDSITDQTHSSQQHITISGTCPSGTYVKLYQNGALVGVANCPSGVTTYVLEIDLQTGANTLEVHVFSITDDEGPLASPITVWYDPPPALKPTLTVTGASLPSPLTIAQLDFQYKIYAANEQINWNIAVSGGTPPYSLNIDWGDGTSTTVKANDTGVAVISHAYVPSDEGVNSYIVKIKATDAGSQEAFVQTVALVRDTDVSIPTGGTADVTPTPDAASGKTGITQWLWLIWPTYGVGVLMAASFWLGEQEKSFHFHMLGYHRFRHRP